MNFVGGHWEIIHPSNRESEWDWEVPYEKWCSLMFLPDSWFFADMGRWNDTIKDYTYQATWVFDNEKDAFMFILQWA